MNKPSFRFSAGTLLIAMLTVAAYLPALGGPFLFDDVIISEENSAVRAPDGLSLLWFRGELPNYEPLTYSVFWLCWQLWGNATSGYHVTNVLLHALTAVLVWRVMRRLEIPGAWLAGLVFGLHPVNVESAAFIFQIRNTLSTALAFAALLAYLRFHEDQSKRWYAAALGLFLLALLSKAAVVMLPLWLLGAILWRERTLTRQDLLRATPFFALSVCLGLTEVWFQNHHAIGNWTVRDDGWVGRLVGSGWAVWFYMSKAALPLRLSFFYPRWTIDTLAPMSYAPLAGLALAVYLAWRYRTRLGRGVLIGMGLYLVGLLPVLGFLDIAFMRYSLVADRWQYMALASLIALTVGSGAVVARTFRPGFRRVAIAGAVLTVIALGVLTGQRAALYADPELLYRDALAMNPKGAACHFGVGFALDCQGRSEEARSFHLAAIELDPGFYEAYINLGTGYALRGDVDSAGTYFEEALRLQPASAKIRISLADLRRRQGRHEESVALYNAVIKGNQRFTHAAQRGLGRTLLETGGFAQATELLEKAVAVDPEDAELRKELGDALAAQDKYTAARDQYGEALRLNDSLATAYVGLGNVCARQGQVAAAVVQFQKALELQPDLAAAHGAWADLCSRLGQPTAARAHYAEALRHNAHCVEAHAALGDLAAAEHKIQEAIQHYEAAVRMRPHRAELRKTLGDLWLSSSHVPEALMEYRAALENRPGWSAVASRIAWLLATCDESRLRDGAEAVRLAEQTCRQTGNRHPVALDTLAAAYAEAGRFPEAIQAARQAVASARSAGAEALAQDAERRLALYQRGQPFRTR